MATFPPTWEPRASLLMLGMQPDLDAMPSDDLHPDFECEDSARDDSSDGSITVIGSPVRSTRAVAKAVDRRRVYRRHRGDGAALVKHKLTRADVAKREPQDWVPETAIRLPASVAAGRVHRMQLFSSFLQVHFPSASAKASLVARGSYLLGLPDHIDIASVPLLGHAIDTVCLAHVGSRYGEEQLIRHSQASYAKVLAGLAREMNGTSSRYDARTIMSSIMLLCLYDDNIPAPKSEINGWKAHYSGAANYLQSQGPAALDVAQPLDRLLYTNLRMPTIMLGMARRKAVVLNGPEWRHLAALAQESSMGDLFHSAFQIPALMERVEKVIHEQADAPRLRGLCDDLIHLGDRFHEWWGVWGADEAVLEAGVVHVSDQDAFDMTIEDHVFMSTSSTFSSFFKFPNPKMAADIVVYWTFRFILDCTLLRLLHFHPMPPRSARDDIRVLLQTLHLNASQLCRSLYYYGSTESQGRTSHLQLMARLAHNFFEETGAVKELGWCQAFLCAVGLRMERLKSTQPPTLCRMGDLVDDLCNISRFRMRDPRLASAG